jgi:hypothetical protein
VVVKQWVCHTRSSQGLCTDDEDECAFPHVRVNPKAPLCAAFSKGWINVAHTLDAAHNPRLILPNYLVRLPYQSELDTVHHVRLCCHRVLSSWPQVQGQAQLGEKIGDGPRGSWRAGREQQRGLCGHLGPLAILLEAARHLTC